MLQILKSGKIFVLTAIVLLFSGCVRSNISQLHKKISSSQSSGIILKVPFIKQKNSFCGPAALSSVFAYWGYRCPQEQIAKDIYRPELSGVLNFDLEQYAKQNGFWAKGYEGDFQELKRKLKSNIPVIVIEKLHPYLFNRRHYMVIVGFIEEDRLIIEHTGSKGFVLRSYAGFLRNWQAAGNWMLEVIPAKDVSRALPPEENAELGFILERQGAYLSALERYQRALQAEDYNATVVFNMGNVYLKMDRLAEAEKAYLEALSIREDFADCYNNLAWLCFRKKEYTQAHIYIDKALSLDDDKRFYYLDTKAQVFFAEGDIEQAIKFFVRAGAENEKVEENILIDFYKNWAENFRKQGKSKGIDKTQTIQKIN